MHSSTMNTTQNPFTPMLLTYNAMYFFGRERELISIIQVITALEPTGHAIYGIRTIGKTTLLKYLKDENGALSQYEQYARAEYRPSTGWRRLFCVYITFHDFKEGDNLFQKMLAQLHDDLMDDIDLSGNVFLQPLSRYTKKQEVTDTLRRILQELHSNDVRVVFLMDDFDMPLHYIDPDDDHLLRNLSEEAALIIATEAPISEIRPDIGKSSPLLGILRPESIDLLSEVAARQLISERLRDTGILFSVQEEDFLINVAGRQPFLLIAACELYFDMHQQFPDITTLVEDSEERKNVYTQFMLRLLGKPYIRDVLMRTWDDLKDDEQETLIRMAYSRKINMLDTRATVAERLANKALAFWDLRSGSYRIFSGLFAEFLQQKYPVTEPPTNGHHHGNEAAYTDTIMSVLDELPPKDRELMQYLYERQNQTCTFDELKMAIWGDKEKTTKRALEAAVFRLRRNLGPDEEIKNIRGEGYKFVVKDRAITQ